MLQHRTGNDLRRDTFLTGILYHLRAADTIQNTRSLSGCYFYTYFSYK